MKKCPFSKLQTFSELHLELFHWGPKATELNDSQVVHALKLKTKVSMTLKILFTHCEIYK